MGIAADKQLRTYQVVGRYEAALERHGQYLRWTRGIACPCVSDTTGQPDPQCPLCRGRRFIYRTPGDMLILQEAIKHDEWGRCWPLHSPVSGNISVYHQDIPLALGTQPSDGSYIQLAPPFLRPWQKLIANYTFSSEKSVVNENSDVYGTNLLRTIATRFNYRGKTFEGSIRSVSRVENISKSETYTVVAAYKEFIYLAGMGTWASGDVLQVDYVHVQPFLFLLMGISAKLRWETPYLGARQPSALEEAEAVMVTPYWAQVSPDDLFTALATEQIGRAVLNPRAKAGNDEVVTHYDLSRLLHVISKNGTEYTVGPGKNVEIFGRNELKWNITKPTVPYTAMFTFHPTYTALTAMETMRNAEGKAFVNRITLKQFDRVHEEVKY